MPSKSAALNPNKYEHKTKIKKKEKNLHTTNNKEIIQHIYTAV